jgi:glycosyl transferase family 25
MSVLPVFVINLDRSADRLAFVQHEARAAGVQFERFAAVDGTAIPDWLRLEFLSADGMPLSRLAPGEIGCYASHLAVHRRIISGGLPFALVLEDDVKLALDLVEIAETAILAAPEGWDYIHLSGRIKRTVASFAALPNGRHLVRHMRIPMNTGGYVISRTGAEKMLKPGPRVRPVDQEIHFAWLRGLDVLGIYPPPVIWGDHLPTTIACTWRTEPKKKHRWGPGLISRLQGHLYTGRKLGIRTYFACRWAGMRFAAERRFLGRPRSAIPVVCAPPVTPSAP